MRKEACESNMRVRTLEIFDVALSGCGNLAA
jgi:hypothetical protein